MMSVFFSSSSSRRMFSSSMVFPSISKCCRFHFQFNTQASLAVTTNTVIFHWCMRSQVTIIISQMSKKWKSFKHLLICKTDHMQSFDVGRTRTLTTKLLKTEMMTCTVCVRKEKRKRRKELLTSEFSNDKRTSGGVKCTRYSATFLHCYITVVFRVVTLSPSW